MNGILNTIFMGVLGICSIILLSLKTDSVIIETNSKIIGIPVNVNSNYILKNYVLPSNDKEGRDSIIKKTKKNNTILVVNLPSSYSGKHLYELDINNIKEIFYNKIYSYYGTDGKIYHTRYFPK